MPGKIDNPEPPFSADRHSPLASPELQGIKPPTGSTAPFSSRISFGPLPGVGAFLREIFRIYILQFRNFFGLAVLAFVFTAILTTITQLFLVPLLALRSFVTLIPATLLIGVLFLWVRFVFTLTFVAVALHNDEEIKTQAFLQIGYKKSWDYFWTWLLASTITLGALSLGLVPGIFLGLAFSLFAVVILAEDKKFFAALLRSRDLIRGHFWYTTTRIFIAGLIVAGISGTISFIAVSLQMFFPVNSSGISIIYFVPQFFAWLLAPLFLIALPVLYKILEQQAPAALPITSKRKFFYSLFIIAIPVVGGMLLYSGAKFIDFKYWLNKLGVQVPATVGVGPSRSVMPQATTTPQNSKLSNAPGGASAAIDISSWKTRVASGAVPPLSYEYKYPQDLKLISVDNFTDRLIDADGNVAAVLLLVDETVEEAMPLFVPLDNPQIQDFTTASGLAGKEGVGKQNTWLITVGVSDRTGARHVVVVFSTDTKKLYDVRMGEAIAKTLAVTE